MWIQFNCASKSLLFFWMRIIDEINLVEYMYKEQFQQGIRPVAVFLGENDVCNGCSPKNIYKTVRTDFFSSFKIRKKSDVALNMLDYP